MDETLPPAARLIDYANRFDDWTKRWLIEGGTEHFLIMAKSGQELADYQGEAVLQFKTMTGNEQELRLALASDGANVPGTEISIRIDSIHRCLTNPKNDKYPELPIDWLASLRSRYRGRTATQVWIGKNVINSDDDFSNMEECQYGYKSNASV